jgi:hypothetical protein
VDDKELEFCKECGMEFPNGMEETCPLCGNEVEFEIDPVDELPIVVGTEISDLERCAVCKKWYDDEDEWFWDFWTDFDSPEWLSIEDVWCIVCILKNFKRDNPDFEASGLEPETFLVWKDALDSGIDLGPRLFDIEVSNAVRRLHECAVSREDMIKWLDSDCPIDEAEQWPNCFDEFEVAMAWRKAGFRIDEDDIEGWLKWNCAPHIAAKFVQQGINEAPGIHYQELGVNLEDAVFYETHEFSDYEDDSEQFYIGAWLPSGLSPTQIVSLRDHLVANVEVFQALHDNSQLRLKYENRTDDFWEALPKNFECLKEVGLPISETNLEKYWGLSSNEILKVIDAGGKPGVVADVIRRGGSVSKLGLIEKLLGLGLLESSAVLLSKRGFLLKHLKQIDESKSVGSTLYRLSEFLEEDAGMKIEDAFAWLDVPYATPKQAKLWRLHGFSGDEAGKWLKEGFNVAEAAKRWRDSGVNSPVTAKRRLDAGLHP